MDSKPLITASLLMHAVMSHAAPVSTPEDPEAHRAGPVRMVVHTFHQPETDRQKFQTYLPYQIGPWSPAVIAWRYNDAGRPNVTGATSAAEAVQTIQSMMALWSAVCNVQWVYLGTTTAVPDFNNPNDGVNVIGWQSMSPPTTGITGVRAMGTSAPYPIVESDIALNSNFNPAFARTVLHELGHMLGLDHSDVSNVVMSGPPLTSYSSAFPLQADDIAGCQFLYGPPASPAISGTITNASNQPVPGVTFCAQPSAGVSCSPSDASGFYQCTVPSGWTGILHAPITAGQRIRPQRFNTPVTGPTTRNVTTASNASFPCNLDVDNNGLVEPQHDGLALLRRMLGMPQSSLTGLAGSCAANTSAAALFSASNPAHFNATDHGSGPVASSDGLLLLRAMQGRTGTDATNGLLPRHGAFRNDWTSVSSWLSTQCGYPGTQSPAP